MEFLAASNGSHVALSQHLKATTTSEINTRQYDTIKCSKVDIKVSLIYSIKLETDKITKKKLYEKQLTPIKATGK